ncbi:MAG: response regulator, partial [Gammaproteobacteria bacterium]|nr:response regulator [Gammaproteobacteria bacterium]
MGHLAGGIAHDFNNILAVILGYTELANGYNSEDKNGKIDGYLKQIKTAGDRATALIAQLQTFGSQTGKEIKSSIDIKSIVEEVNKLIEETFPATILINLELGESIPAIDADPVQLHQVIMNLFVNARDAIEGHGQITVKLEREHMNGALCHSCQQQFDGDFVTLSVSDNGAGIEPSTREHIFEPFYTTKAAGKGTGMGLSIVHGIVHEVDGHIQLESEFGKGTTLSIFFPVSTLTEELSEEDRVDKNRCEQEGICSSVMVVDDEFSIARYLEEMFTMQGYRVSMFTDSRDALQAFQKDPDAYDIVISDQTMPIMTGLEMTRKMLQLRSDLPVILCTGYSDSLTETNVKVAGVKTILHKPIDTTRLLQEMHRLIKH